MHAIRSVLSLLLVLTLLVGVALASEAPSDEAIYEQALSLAQNGDPDAAIVMIEEALPAFSGSVRLYTLLGDIHYAHNRYAESYEAYHRAAELDPESYEHFLCEADALFFQGLLAEACESFSKAIELNPTMGYLYGCRGDTWYLQGDFDKALVDFQQQITLGSVDSGAMARKAFAEEALARDLPFPQSDDNVIVNAEAHSALRAYFDGGDAPSKDMMLSYMLLAQLSGLPCAGMLFPELSIDASENASANYPIHEGAWINVPLDLKKQVKGYILYQRYDAPMYPHAAKFADVFLMALFEEKPPVTYAELKQAQFAQRRWEPLTYTYGDMAVTLYFLDGAEALLIQPDRQRSGDSFRQASIPAPEQISQGTRYQR